MSEVITQHAGRDEVLQTLYLLIRAVPGMDPDIQLNEQTTIAELALDSLRLIEIVFELERHFDHAADEGLMAEARTTGDIAALFCRVEPESDTDV